ncbi:MAG: asparagine synthase (glutamine-hydrolyzing) [Acidobacteriaceae bacterium]|nr:asparagine synthase (glutamine-hydrolyzing) [Acidobacteriaceae bacterium]
MCGIAGVFNHRSNGRVDAAVLARMRDTMTHRGPDGGDSWISPDGRVGLAQRRLSIIDLSTSASQPMSNEDGTVWVTFNGEIYNHAGLRQELIAAGHNFRTHHSDTEVLVHGYEQWGIDGLTARLSGDYAIGLWDSNTETLSLIRDRIGVKPLYFSLQGGAILFASEIKAILGHPSVSRDIDANAMYHYLSFLTTPAPMTMFKGVFKLPAGYYAQIKKNGELRSKRYWDAAPGQGIADSEVAGLSDSAREQFYIDGIRKRLDDAINERMMSDVPFGSFLSGGIDSSAIVALMSKQMSRPVDTFTVGFSDHTHLNELDYARAVAKQFRTNHHEVLINEADMMGYLENLIHSQDEPLADWVCIPLYFVSKLAKDSGVTVIQVGEGSDEQFSGYANYMGYLSMYNRYWKPFKSVLPGVAQKTLAGVAGQVGKLKPGLEVYTDIVKRAANNREHFWTGAVAFWETTKSRLIENGAIQPNGISEELVRSGMLPASYFQTDSFNVVRSFYQPFDTNHPGQDVLSRMIYSEFKLRLPELLLMRVDKVTMSLSLEARVPFLAHKLIEFTADIPMDWKVRNNTAKYLLKKAVQGLIPDEIIYRKKMGFGAPMAHWLRGAFGQRVEKLLLGSGLMERGYFNRAVVKGLFADHRSGRQDNGLYLWTLFNLSSWYDYWIESPVACAA